MISIKMADEDVHKADNFMNTLNRLGQTNQTEDIDEILSALLSSSLSAPPAEEFNDIDDISCEYTELNNTIDALNSYLDVWEERHRNLRAKVRAALVEGEADEAQESGSQEELKGVAVSGSMVSEHGLQDDSVTSSNSVDPASAVIQSTAKQSHDA